MATAHRLGPTTGTVPNFRDSPLTAIPQPRGDLPPLIDRVGCRKKVSRKGRKAPRSGCTQASEQAPKADLRTTKKSLENRWWHGRFAKQTL